MSDQELLNQALRHGWRPIEVVACDAPGLERWYDRQGRTSHGWTTTRDRRHERVLDRRLREELQRRYAE